MEIREVNEKHKVAWNKIANHPLQTWEWGEFRQKTGNRVIRLGVFSEKKLVSGYQITVHPVPFSKFWVGAFLKGPEPDKVMLEALRELGHKENLISIRMEPNVRQDVGKFEKFLREGGAVPGRPFFTKESFWIDLTRSEEELLARLHPKTRYNIRVAQKHGIRVREDNSQNAFETYLDLTEQTTKRQGFYAHTETYHKIMWETLRPAGIARLLTARYKGKILVTWILFVWRDFLYYPYGASSDQYRNLMPSYAIMWEAIKLGKRLGLKTFDLWGREPGKGFTRFKEGFAPQIVEFLGTWDLVINPKIYPLMRLLEEVRWKVLRARTKLPIKTPGPRFR